ncbi:ABC transporter substrate-binding protein [Haloferax chudinovii]|uniref:ABC transporter substrate-binding protein n=1 Tax=Haloferax chudinovii TaxID=1109010 RepID=A0ABD5XMD5_9EURY
MSDSNSNGTGDSGAGSSGSRGTTRLTRRNWIRTAGAAGIAGLAGCTGGGSGNDGGGTDSNGDGTTTGGSDDVTTIEIWRWPHSTEPSNTGEDEIVELFNEGPGAEQGIHVEQVKNPFGDHQTKVKTAIGSKSAPDIAWTFTQQYYDFAGKDRSTIEEEAPYVYIDDYVSDDWLGDFYEKELSNQRTKFGGVVGAPFISGLQPGLLYLNVDAWEAAGLGEVPTDSWSYEEYLEAVEAIHGVEANGSMVNGVGIGLKDATGSEWSNFPGTIGVTAGSLIGNGYQRQDDKYVLTMASDPELEAWNEMFGKPLANGWTNNPLSYDYLETQEPFIGGQIGLLHHATFSRVQFGQEADFNWEIVPYPTKGGNENYSVFSAGAGVLVTMTAFKEEVGGNPEAAAEFIKFRNNARNQYRWFNTSSQAIPNKGSYELMNSEGVSDFVEQTGGKDIMARADAAYSEYQSVREAIKSRYPDIKTTSGGAPVTDVPSGIASGRVGEALGGMLQRLAQNGNSNPQEAFTQAEGQWADLIVQADDTEFAEESRGYNKPEPKAGPI